MEEYFYEVNLSWKSENTGKLTSHGLQEIDIASPLGTSKGNKSKWTSEQLLAASVSYCFMTTFLEIAENAKLEVNAYHSQCFVKLEKVKGKYITSEILLRPLIKLNHESDTTKAYKCIEESETACPIRNSLRINVEVHPQFDYLNKGTKVKVG